MPTLFSARKRVLEDAGDEVLELAADQGDGDLTSHVDGLDGVGARLGEAGACRSSRRACRGW